MPAGLEVLKLYLENGMKVTGAKRAEEVTVTPTSKPGEWLLWLSIFVQPFGSSQSYRPRW
jgi:hypothetical protein